MNNKVDKPVLTSKGQAARFKQLEETLKERERELEQREAAFQERGNKFIQQLEQMHQELLEREQKLDERERSFKEMWTSRQSKPRPIVKRTETKALGNQDLEKESLQTVTVGPSTTSTINNATSFSFSSVNAIPSIPLTSAFLQFAEPTASPFSFVPSAITPRVVLETEPQKAIAVPSMPSAQIAAKSSLVANPSTPKKGKKQKKKEISPFKNPLRYIIVNRRAIGIGVAVTMFNAGIAGYLAYVGRDVVATRIAEQTNALQRKNLALQKAQLDPFRKLRDRLIEEDPCRSGYAFQKIAENYSTFVEQTPSRQLEVLALDPKIRANINTLAQGGALERGVCNLFE